MMRPSPSVTLLALTLALVSTPRAAQAQFGKLVKKAKEAVSAEKSGTTPVVATSSPVAAPVRVDPAFELTADNLDRFTVALQAERAARQETLKLFAGMKSTSAYAICAQGAGTSAGYQKIFNRYVEDAPKATTPEASAAVTKKFADDATAYLLSSCGANPDDYPPNQRESIVRSKAFEAGIEKSGLERRNYAVLKERIVPYCTADTATRAAAEVKVPGQGRNVFFVYLPSESAQLGPRCDVIMSAMQAVS